MAGGKAGGSGVQEADETCTQITQGPHSQAGLEKAPPGPRDNGRLAPSPRSRSPYLPLESIKLTRRANKAVQPAHLPQHRYMWGLHTDGRGGQVPVPEPPASASLCPQCEDTRLQALHPNRRAKCVLASERHPAGDVEKSGLESSQRFQPPAAPGQEAATQHRKPCGLSACPPHPCPGSAQPRASDTPCPGSAQPRASSPHAQCGALTLGSGASRTVSKVCVLFWIVWGGLEA